ncbi:NADP-dependent leukotriene B4 12-hydroxydehydrogenase [Schizosaccharomyces japonicus yFS275]|uniref:NADP-dependent leukotriene B4 12-hydroxydehydrogenase n=1 Tax=Schizosaccharomyces japonicus (strain yFS275 / FY16936) TaxID=402676 RepID=B6K0G9_SCHJY|nr:NADP-dependent leukotriene B4 12-hydroxydehydrogenase [Schizosaccharomyces japonicus yFS275]EEB06319.2 NADP-dependent leukotriene B4 12-hydroxydehydrogenase [Schizosaccharomyces japonicus yFS275]
MQDMSNNAVIVRKLMQSSEGYPKVGENIDFVRRPYDASQLQLSDNFPVLAKVLYISVDPFLKLRLIENLDADEEVTKPFEEGKPLSCYAVVTVIDSLSEKWKKGDRLFSFANWEEYTLLSTQTLESSCLITDKDDSMLKDYLGVLGMAGHTAYIGLKHVGHPKANETVLVSSACGAVGMMAGQLAKSFGCYVVGSAGSDEKVEFLKNELHFDDAFNYKKENYSDALKRTCPKGIDVYFDNVGGELLDTVFLHANLYARIIYCGALSQYCAKEPYGLKNTMQMITKCIRFEGFSYYYYYSLYWDECCSTIKKLLSEQKLHFKLDMKVGLEQTPEAFTSMLQGKNFGKVIVQVAQD